MKKYITILVRLCVATFIIYGLISSANTGSPSGLVPLFIWFLCAEIKEDKKCEQSNGNNDVEC